MLKKTLGEIATFLNAVVKSHVRPTAATCDSRRIERGGLFFALKGEKHDGHTFLREVASRGGLSAVVSKHYQGPDYGLSLIHVEDVNSSLRALAKWVHAKDPPYVLAVTGSVGKTMTKEFISDVLGAKKRIAKSIGSQNSQASLPLFLLKKRPPIDVLVLEMGMSFSGELTKLVDMVPPDFGVLTKVSLVHSAHFKDIDEIAAAKMELFENTKEGLFNLETIDFLPVRKGCVHKTSYSIKNPRADYFLKQQTEKVFILERGIPSPPLTVPLRASHLLENFLCAASVARMHGLTWDEIQQGARNIRVHPHRFHVFKRQGICYVDDAYNASVASFKAALDNLPKGRKVVALMGDMRELGAFSVQCHEEVARHALPIVDHLLCMGNEIDPVIDIFKKGRKAVEKVHSIEEAKRRLQEVQEVGDVVLIKGSNALQLWKVLD